MPFKESFLKADIYNFLILHYVLIDFKVYKVMRQTFHMKLHVLSQLKQEVVVRDVKHRIKSNIMNNKSSVDVKVKLFS